MLKYTVQAAPVWPFRSEEMETAERREAMLGDTYVEIADFVVFGIMCCVLCFAGSICTG